METLPQSFETEFVNSYVREEIRKHPSGQVEGEKLFLSFYPRQKHTDQIYNNLQFGQVQS